MISPASATAGRRTNPATATRAMHNARLIGSVYARDTDRASPLIGGRNQGMPGKQVPPMRTMPLFPDLFAGNTDSNSPGMRGTAVLKEKKSLPGAKHHAPVNDRDILVHIGQAHANV